MAQVDSKSRLTCRMKERLVTAAQSGTNALALGGATPIRGGRYRTRVGTEAQQEGVAAVLLPDELPEVVLAVATYLRCARIA